MRHDVVAGIWNPVSALGDSAITLRCSRTAPFTGSDRVEQRAHLAGS
jgi:hypothetical protein